MSLDVKTIHDLMADTKVGSVVTYDDITAAIGRDARHNRGAMHSAMRILKNSKRMVFGCVPKVGYKRLSDEEIIDSGDDCIARIRRLSRRGAKTLACVEFDALSPQDKLRHNAKMTVLALTQESTTHTAVKRIEQAVSDANAALPCAKAAIAALAGIA